MNNVKKLHKRLHLNWNYLHLPQQLSKEEARLRKKNNQKIYVLDFKGDTAASAVENLREEITLILATAKAGRDRVVVRLESPGRYGARLWSGSCPAGAFARCRF